MRGREQEREMCREWGRGGEGEAHHHPSCATRWIVSTTGVISPGFQFFVNSNTTYMTKSTTYITPTPVIPFAATQRHALTATSNAIASSNHHTNSTLPTPTVHSAAWCENARPYARHEARQNAHLARGASTPHWRHRGDLAFGIVR